MQTLGQTTTTLNSLTSNALLSPLTLLPKLNTLTLTPRRSPSTLIRMGGGPRTFPGGVSKWQWKRMQSKKAKQLLKARLSRERQIYEMRKRAELKAAVSDLERPWELVQKSAPSSSSLFSVSADEQLKVLADRFQKPGGYDLWTENDGPQIFLTPDDELPSARFFPKGVVHSIRPYGRIDQGNVSFSSEGEISKSGGPLGKKQSEVKARRNDKRIGSRDGDGSKTMDTDSKYSEGPNSKCLNASEQRSDRNWRRNQISGVSRTVKTRKRFGSEDKNGLMNMKQEKLGLEHRNMGAKVSRDGKEWPRRSRNSGKATHLQPEDVYDMSLQRDGTYGFSGSDQD